MIRWDELDAFHEGYEAGTKGDIECPYPGPWLHDINKQAWVKGWDKAQEGPPA